MPINLLSRAGIVAAIALASSFLLIFPDNSAPDAFAHFASDGFNTGFQIFAHLLIFYTAWRWRSRQPFLLDLGVTFTVNLVLQVSKHFLKTAIAIRPSGGYEGFPSGHAAATFSLAYLLSLYYPRLWWAWYGAAAVVTWSRVQTNAHTELQIAAGMLLGTLTAFAFARAMWKQRNGSVAS